MDKQQEILKVIARRSHILVYSYHVCNEQKYYELRKLLSVLKDKIIRSANGNGEERKIWYPTYVAMLEGLDPKGNKILRLPKEVPLQLLKEVWPSHKFLVDENSWKGREIEVEMNPDVTFKDSTQKKMYEYIQGHLFTDKKEDTLLLETPTASGKTFSTLYAWTERKTVLGAIFAQKAHLENFKQEILKFTNIKEKEICIIQGKDSIDRALKKIDTYKVFLMMNRTLNSILDKCNLKGTLINPISNFIFKAGIGFLIFDEAHLEFRGLINLSLVLNVDQILYLTATASRTEWYEKKVLHLQIPYHRRLSINPEKRHIARIRKYTSNFDPLINAMFIKDERFTSYEYFNYMVKNKDFFQFILNLIEKELLWSFEEEKHENVAIVLSSTINFINILAEKIQEMFPNKTIGKYTSEIANIKEKQKELDTDIVITTEKSFNGSINPLKLEHMLFFSHLDSKISTEQVVGRLRGKNGKDCIITDFVDMSIPNIVHQYRSRFNLYKKRLAKEIIELKGEPKYEQP